MHIKMRNETGRGREERKQMKVYTSHWRTKKRKKNDDDDDADADENRKQWILTGKKVVARVPSLHTSWVDCELHRCTSSCTLEHPVEGNWANRPLTSQSTPSLTWRDLCGSNVSHSLA